MRNIAAALVVLTVSLNASASLQGKSWLSAPSEVTEESGIPLPVEDSCEVPLSKLPSALSKLQKATHIVLDPAKAKGFVGGCVKIVEGKTPYLVRAVYGHRGTGRYSVRQLGNNLLVTHGSLGRYDTYTKSALVVNLSFKPRRVFIMAGIDQ